MQFINRNHFRLSHGEITRTFRSVELPFSEILINNHIGYIEEIEENYKCSGKFQLFVLHICTLQVHVRILRIRKYINDCVYANRL